MPEIETDVPFNVSGVKNAAEGGAAVVLTFYKRPHRRPDAHFALTPHAALHLTQYIRETLAESEVLGADADPILPPHPSQEQLEQAAARTDAWATDDPAKTHQLDARSRGLLLEIFGGLSSVEQQQLLKELGEVARD